MFFSEVHFCAEHSNVLSFLNVSGPPLSQNYKARNLKKVIPSFLVLVYLAASPFLILNYLHCMGTQSGKCLPPL